MIDSNNVEENMSLAGMDDEEGRLARPLEALTWSLKSTTKVELIGEGAEHGLVFGKIAELEGATHITHPANTKGMLDQFIKLADAEPKRFLEFARRWGQLGLCSEHGEVATHTGRCLPSREESVEAWRAFSKRVRAILHVGAQLHQIGNGDKRAIPGTPEDWASIFPELPPRRLRNSYQDIDKAKVSLADAIHNDFVMLGSVHLEFTWNGERPMLSLDGWFAFGHIAMQLAFAVLKSNLALCSGCGNPYERKKRDGSTGRAPKRGQNNWCANCKLNGADRRSADKAYRSRMRSRES